MNDPNRTPQGPTRNNRNNNNNNSHSDEFTNPIPFILREEFNAFATHYNDNTEKAVQTVSNLQFIVGKLLDRVSGLRKRGIVMIIWNTVLTVALVVLGMEVYYS